MSREFVIILFNMILDSEKRPKEWLVHLLMPISKNKGDVQSCSNYWGIELMSQSMNIWARVVWFHAKKEDNRCHFYFENSE